MLRPVCRVILWSDEPEALTSALEAAGCEVLVATEEVTVAEWKATKRPEVIFFHERPAGACGRIRRSPPPLPIVYCELVAATHLGCFDVSAGYDDLLVLPLQPEEITARVRLWRWRRDQISAEGALRAGPVVVDMTNYRVLVNGAPVQLTLKEYQLLCLMLRRRGQVLNREAILDAIWGPDYFGGNRTVDVHVRRLRQKVPEVAEMIGTVHGVGYRFDLLTDSQQ